MKRCPSLPSTLLLPLATLALACGRVPLQSPPDAGSSGGGSTGGTSTGGSTGGSSTGGTGGAIALAVTPPVATASVGTQVSFTATATFADQHTQDVTAQATWTSSAPAVATVGAGVATAVSAGQATISAAYGGQRAQASLTVPAAPIVAIAVTPPAQVTNIGAAAAFTATALLGDGTHQDVTASAIWTSSDPQVASVAGGVALGLSAGSTTLTAAVGKISGGASLTVNGAPLQSIAVTPTDPFLASGATQQMQAIGTYQDGSIADLTGEAAWTSSNPTAVAVAAGGLVTAVAAGTSTVTATVGGVGGGTLVTVNAAPLASIAVTPAATTLVPGGTVQLAATATYQDGTQADVTSAALWSSSSAAVSVSNAVGAQGLATAVAAGPATITAAIGSVSGSAQVTVTGATLQSIAISPASAQTAIGTTLQYAAQGSFSDGSQVNLTAQATWSTGSAAIAIISNAAGSAGLASAVAAGSTTVQATFQGVVGTAKLTVTTGTLQSITLAPADPQLVAGDRLAETATGNYSDGTQANLTAQAVWQSSDSSVATVSNAPGAQGQIFAVAAGSATISATFSSIQGSTPVAVSAPTATSLVVSPASATDAVGQSQSFTATLVFSNFTSQDVTRQASWTSSNSSVATVAKGGPGGGGPPGRATTLAAGSTTITASYQGLSGAAQLTVTSALPVSISVAPIDPALPAGTTQQLSATAIYSDGSSQDVTRQATWLSSDTAAATVNTRGGGGGPGGGGGGPGNGPGLVTAVAPGSAQISASWSGLTGATTVTVTSAVVVSISVSPSSATLVASETVPFGATAIYSDGSSKDITSQATWTSTDAGVAAVSDGRGSKGQVTAISAGSAQIQASYQGVTGGSAVTVSSATVQQILISPSNPSVAAGTPVDFTAQALFSDGSSQGITGQATWTSSDTSVAQVSTAGPTSGHASTFAAGSATVTATWQGVSGSTTLTVTAATLVQIQLTPFAPELYLGFPVQLAATGLYSDNSTQDLTKLATWTSSAPSIAAVDDGGGAKGLVTPAAAGPAVISAAYQGVTGTDQVTVSSATLASIAVTPGTATIAVGATEPYGATGTFSDGSSMDVTTYVTWLSSSDSVAPISNAAGSQGQAKGLAPGSVTITAVKGSVQGTASLTVS
ncbi:MAG: beta strand repeat-containing protein [Myxococcales bacterium]